MKKVRFLIDLYDMIEGKFYSYNDVAEIESKKADRFFKDGLVDILIEEPKKKAAKPKKAPKAKKEDKKEDKK